MGYRFRRSRSLRAGAAVFAPVVTSVTSVTSVIASVLLTILLPLAAGQTPASLSKPVSASKNAAAKRTSAWTPSRTPDGQPDLEGIWNNSTITPLQRPRELAGKEFFTPEEAVAYQRKMLSDLDTDRRDPNPEADVNRSYNELFRERGGVVATLRTSLIVDPPDGRIPPLTESARKREAARAADQRKRGPADSWTDRNLAERCLTRGAPKLPGGYNNNFQIYQTPGYVAIFHEMIHETRIIPLDGRPHVDKGVRLWLGDSRGHWEGNTLVIDTTNFNDKIISNNFNCCGASGESLHVVERLTRVSADRIDYRYTVDDPATYTRPWTVDVPMMKSDGPLYEYACHEGNYALEDILKGAREQEKAAASKKK
jgi:hypothetical protein